MDVSKTVRRIAIFGELNETESSAITDRVVQLDLKRAQELVREGDKSDAIFVVLFGRFSVYAKSRSEPIAEISDGELIGEIGFFSGLSYRNRRGRSRLSGCQAGSDCVRRGCGCKSKDLSSDPQFARRPPGANDCVRSSKHTAHGSANGRHCRWRTRRLIAGLWRSSPKSLWST